MVDVLPVASTNEVTPVDHWHWRVYFEDGSLFNEFDAMGLGHGWSEIDPSKVITIEMVPQTPSYPHVLCEIPVGGIAVFERRRRIATRLEDMFAYDYGTLVFLGWDHPVGVCSRIILTPDGKVCSSYRPEQPDIPLG